MSEPHELLVVVLVTSSALLHASWNVAARRLKGNMSILILAHVVGALMMLPFALAFGDLANSIANIEVYTYFFPSLCFHSAYIGFLAIAYYYGEVGLVYPLARGTAITVATIVVEETGIASELSDVQNIGIGIVVCGILVLGNDAYWKIFESDLPANGYSEGIEISNPIIFNDEESSNDIIGATSSNVQLSPMHVGDIEMHSQVNKNEMISPHVSDADLNGNSTSPLEMAAATSSANQASPSDEIVVKSTVIRGNTYDDIKKHVKRGKFRITFSVIFAVCCGLCVACYSISDSYAVNIIPAITYAFLYNLCVAIVYMPYIYAYKYEELVDAVTVKWMYLPGMGVATTGAYMIILYVFEIPGVNIALVVTLRELSVLIGTTLGVFLLKEKLTVSKIIAVILICIGMSLLILE